MSRTAAFVGRTTSSTSSNAGECSLEAGLLYNTNWNPSLEKEPPRRATPWRMLEHPWVLDMKNKKVNMANFVRQVWDWKE
mgnify:CR=1 FL=1